MNKKKKKKKSAVFLVIKSFKTLDPDPDSLEMHEIIFTAEAFFYNLVYITGPECTWYRIQISAHC
jgi:hypothetical protein